MCIVPPTAPDFLQMQCCCCSPSSCTELPNPPFCSGIGSKSRRPPCGLVERVSGAPVAPRGPQNLSWAAVCVVCRSLSGMCVGGSMPIVSRRHRSGLVWMQRHARQRNGCRGEQGFRVAFRPICGPSWGIVPPDIRVMVTIWDKEVCPPTNNGSDLDADANSEACHAAPTSAPATFFVPQMPS